MGVNARRAGRSVDHRGGSLWASPVSLAFVAIVVLTLSACSAGTQGSTERHIADQHGLMPLTSLAQEGSDLVSLLEVKVDELVAPCMREQGFEYHPRRFAEGADLLPIQPPELTIERAEKLGYRWPESLEQTNRERETEAYLDGLGETGRREWGSALLGSGENMLSIEVSFGRLETPVDGCLANARSAIAGGVEDAARWYASLNEIEALYGQAVDRTRSDELVLKAAREWRVCMRSEGFEVISIQDAVRLAWSSEQEEPIHDSTDSEETTPSEWEVTIAVADAKCRNSSGYRVTYEDRRSYHENAVLAENEQIIFNWGEARADLEGLLDDLMARLQ